MVYTLGKTLGYTRGMRRWLLTLGTAASVGFGMAPIGAQEPTTQDRPTFRAGVDVVSVGATVRDRKGRLVSGLTKGDFVVLDGGEPRAIADFQTEAQEALTAVDDDGLSGQGRDGEDEAQGGDDLRHVDAALERVQPMHLREIRTALRTRH